jgi:hypothetical protein
MVPYLLGLPSMWSTQLCHAQIAHKSNACASPCWCLNQWLKLFPENHVRKTLASILSEKATAVIRRVKERRTHSTTCEAKKVKNRKSI